MGCGSSQDNTAGVSGKERKKAKRPKIARLAPQEDEVTLEAYRHILIDEEVIGENEQLESHESEMEKIRKISVVVSDVPTTNYDTPTIPMTYVLNADEDGSTSRNSTTVHGGGLLVMNLSGNQHSPGSGPGNLSTSGCSSMRQHSGGFHADTPGSPRSQNSRLSSVRSAMRGSRSHSLSLQSQQGGSSLTTAPKLQWAETVVDNETNNNVTQPSLNMAQLRRLFGPAGSEPSEVPEDLYAGGGTGGNSSSSDSFNQGGNMFGGFWRPGGSPNPQAEGGAESWQSGRSTPNLPDNVSYQSQFSCKSVETISSFQQQQHGSLPGTTTQSYNPTILAGPGVTSSSNRKFHATSMEEDWMELHEGGGAVGGRSVDMSPRGSCSASSVNNYPQSTQSAPRSTTLSGGGASPNQYSSVPLPPDAPALFDATFGETKNPTEHQQQQKKPNRSRDGWSSSSSDEDLDTDGPPDMLSTQPLR